MKLINGNIDQIFKESLSDFNVTPPDKVWDRIENDLIFRKKRLVIPVFLKIAAIVLLLLGGIGLIFRFSNKKTDNEQVVENIKAPVEILKNESITSKNTVITNEEKYPVFSNQQKKKDIINETEITQPEILQEKTFANKEEPAIPENNDLIHAQLAHNADINNIYLNEESEMEMTGVSATQVVPVYYSSRTNAYNSLYAEEIKSTKDRNVQWSIGGQAGPQYSYREVFVNDAGYQNIDLDEYETGMITYAGGINIQLGASKRFTVQSGVYYSKIGTNKAEILSVRSNNLDIYGFPEKIWFENLPSDIANSTGSFTYDNRTNPNTQFDEPNIEYKKGENIVQECFEFIEIPFVVRYKIIDRKLDIDLNGGIWTNFLIDMDATSTSNNPINITMEPDNIHKVNYSGSLGIGFDFPITSSILFNLEPVFKYYLSPINKIEETEVHPYTFGIMTGIRYSF